MIIIIIIIIIQLVFFSLFKNIIDNLSKINDNICLNMMLSLYECEPLFILIESF